MDIGALTGTLIGCVVMAAAVALTAWRVDLLVRREGTADDYFWVLFGGVVVMTGAGVLAGTAGGPGALMGVGVGLGSAVVAAIWLFRRHGRRRSVAVEAAWAGLRRRHDAAVQRWTDYDVDPAKAIDHPGMHDPSGPTAQPIIRALRVARLERAGAEESAGAQHNPPPRYVAAVAELERAVDAAERALGVCEAPRAPARGGHRADLESLPAGQFRRVPGS